MSNRRTSNARTWPQHCAVLVINEIVPRAKKHGIDLSAPLFSALTALAIRGEFDGEYRRHETRRYLDRICEMCR